MPAMRAKVKLNSLIPGQGYETLVFNPVPSPKYDEHGRDEDNTFAKYSPSGQFTITIANPVLLGAFKVGEIYYVDFTLVPETLSEKA